MAKEPSTTLALPEQRYPTDEEMEMMLPAILDGKNVKIEVADPELVSRDILNRMLSAETFEEAFQPQALESWSDYEGVPVFVQSFRFNKSTFEQGSPVYAVCVIARADDGTHITVTTGGRNVLLGLVLMVQKGWTDKPVKLVSQATGSGNTVLRLVPA